MQHRFFLVLFPFFVLLVHSPLSHNFPHELIVKQIDVQESVIAIDNALAGTSMGAYIIAIGAKP